MKYKTMWDWLGIPQTEEIAAIKKAFAEKSKEYHPEEFPQEFQALQKAYHAAMAYAKAQKRAADQNAAVCQAAGRKQEEPAEKRQEAAGRMTEEMARRASESGRTEETRQGAGAKSAGSGRQENVGRQEALSSQTDTQDRRMAGTRRGAGPKSARNLQPDSQRDDAKFNYDAVDHVLEKERWETLIAEFVNIGYSTFLRNRLECWQFFFRQDKYQDLLSQTSTWKEIIYQIKLIGGWARQTILYLEACMHQHLAGRVSPEDYPVFPGWIKRRRFRPAEKIKTSVKLQACAKEQELDAFIRDQIRRRDIAADTENYYACYLDIYLPYAVKNPQAVEWFHRMKSDKLRGYQILSVIFLCCAVMACLTLAGSMPDDAKTTRQVEKKIEDIQREIEFDENVIPYQDEKYREEMDRVMEDAIESYETWRQKMEQYDFEGTET